MTTRRDVLRNLPLIALAPSIPGFLARAARAASPRTDDRVLVVIQLDGGNDGINTVVPFGEEGYTRHRPTLALPANRLIPIADGVGLHPALAGAGRMLEAGRLAIVPGVGYPNPERSHFRSLAIWQTARLDPADHAKTGWVGRGLDARAREARPARGPASLAVGAGPLPVALRGVAAPASTLDQIDDLTLAQPNAARPAADALLAGRDPASDLASFVRRATLDAHATADRLAALGRDDSGARYPASALAQRLGLIARLIKGELGTRVFYILQPGYDTHAAQLGTHARLLGELSAALEAFQGDLAAAGLLNRVLVLAFSEFGRRVAENGVAGTDHGTSGPVLLAGTHIQPGLIGPYPSLTDLIDGDLKMTVDFRRIYATVLDQWLGVPAAEVLGQRFEHLPMLRV